MMHEQVTQVSVKTEGTPGLLVQALVSTKSVKLAMVHGVEELAFKTAIELRDKIIEYVQSAEGRDAIRGLANE